MPIANYNFLLKQKFLQEFITDNDLDLYVFAFKLFRRLNYFKSISLMFKKCHVGILNNWDGNECILRCNRKKYKLAFDRLVRTVNLYKKERPNSVTQSWNEYSAPVCCKKKYLLVTNKRIKNSVNLIEQFFIEFLVRSSSSIYLNKNL